MRLNKFFAFALCSLAFAGCQKQNSGTGEVGSGTLRFSGTTELPAGRTTLADDGLAISWDAGDKVAIFAASASNATAGVNVEYQTTGSGTSSDFAAVGTAITPTAGESNTFYSYYPYASGAADATAIAVSVPQAQTQAGAANEIGKIAFMAATPVVVAAADLSEPISMAYNQIFAIMEIPVAKRTDGKTLASIELSSDATLAANPLWGAGTIDVTQATFPVAGFAAAGNTDNKITLTFAAALDLTTDQKAWILVNPTNHGTNSKLTVKLNLGDGTNESYTVKGGDIQRGKRYVLPAPVVQDGYGPVANGLDMSSIPTPLTASNWVDVVGTGLIRKVSGKSGGSEVLTDVFQTVSFPPAGGAKVPYMVFDGVKPDATKNWLLYDGSTAAANGGFLQTKFAANDNTVGLWGKDVELNFEFNQGVVSSLDKVSIYPRISGLASGKPNGVQQLTTMGSRITDLEIYVTDGSNTEKLVAKFVYTTSGNGSDYPLSIAAAGTYAPFDFEFVDSPTGNYATDQGKSKIQIANPKSARFVYKAKKDQQIPALWIVSASPPNIELSEVEFWGEPVI